MSIINSENIRLVQKTEGELTLYIGLGQAMQAWEKDLMEFSADLLVSFGSVFAEAGLGLGLSALRVCAHRHVTQHSVIELYPEVIRLFHARQPSAPTALQIINEDFFGWIRKVPPSSLDGIFFDPALSSDIWGNSVFWEEQMPWIVRAIRTGGVFIPFFTTRPVLREQYLGHFSEIRCYPRSFDAYADTNYTFSKSGTAIVQCYIKR